MSQNPDQVDKPDATASTNLGSYFDSSIPTIFDEIVSNKTDDGIPKNNATKFNMPPGTPSGNIFESDSSFEEQSNEHAIVSDSHRDAWIPSENTRKILRAITTSTHSNSQLDRDNLTMPGLAIAEEMNDPIKEAVTHLLGEEEILNRNVLSASDVSQVEYNIYSYNFSMLNIGLESSEKRFLNFCYCTVG